MIPVPTVSSLPIPWFWLVSLNRSSIAAIWATDIKASAHQMLYGFEPTLPGQILNASDHTESVQELEQLLLNQKTRVSMPAIQPSAHKKQEKALGGIPDGVTHVYTKQHKALGLQPSFAGPFPVEERLSRSTFKLKVGYKVSGEPIIGVREFEIFPPKKL